MALDDFLGDMVELGGGKKRWRSVWAILCTVLGAGIGAYLGYLGYFADGLYGVISGFFGGALVGWVLAMLLAGFLIFGLILAAVLLITFAWTWLTGGS